MTTPGPTVTISVRAPVSQTKGVDHPVFRRSVIWREVRQSSRPVSVSKAARKPACSLSFRTKRRSP